MFVKMDKKTTLEENFIKALVVEKDMVAIGVHNTQEDSKDIGKKPQSLMSKSSEKEIADLESVVKSLKLINEVSDLKRRTRKFPPTKNSSRHSSSVITIPYPSPIKFQISI